VHADVCRALCGDDVRQSANSAQDINRRPMLIICSHSPFTATDSARPLTNRQTPRLGSTVRGGQQIGNSTAKDGHR